VSSQGNGRQPVVYRVQLSEHQRNWLARRHTEEAHAGKGSRFVAALRLVAELFTDEKAVVRVEEDA